MLKATQLQQLIHLCIRFVELRDFVCLFVKFFPPTDSGFDLASHQRTLFSH